jgi:7-cyano-7-deazaguanine synthase in queuosine biosynthesis
VTVEYDVLLPGEAREPNGIALELGKNLLPGWDDFAHQFEDVTSLEHDLMTIAASIFAADRATKRGEREDFGRTISITIPVVNAARIAPLAGLVERMLRTLSNDSWRIAFRQSAGQPESLEFAEPTDGVTLLFSGGLDSLAGAVRLLEDGRSVQLVGHITRNRQTIESQSELVGLLEGAGYAFEYRKFFVSSRDGGPSDLKHDVENSQRTRSFLFLVLAGLVARRTGHLKVLFIAENGQFAIHLPLSAARIGAFSTHTAHPSFVVEMENFLSKVLDVDIDVENPFLYSTKAEVAKIVIDHLPDALSVSTSCWMNARLSRDEHHCGECIPCMMRRVAVEIHQPDPTRYRREIWAERVGELPPGDDGRRNAMDLCEFVKRFELENDQDLMSIFPELYSPHINASDAIEMYRRFSGEARSVLSNYAPMAALLV